MHRRTFISAALGLGVLVTGAGWRALQAPPGRIVRDAGVRTAYTGADLAFGTVVSIRVVHEDQRQAELAIADALQEARKVDALMSIYAPGSQVFQLNQHGRVEHPHAHLLTALTQARDLSRLTAGAFDVTVQPLWNLFSQGVESAAAHRQARALVNWRDLALDASRVAFLRPGMAITLNGIAQGYAVDLAREALQARGIRHALIDTGEFSRLGRRADGQDWTLGLRDPRHAQSICQTLRMDDRCVATSGDYAMPFTPDFSRHHIFDPHTGESPPELASVTVLAPSGILADGLSTACMVLGSARALALMGEMDGVDAMLIDKAGKTWRSAGFPAAGQNSFS